MDINLSVIRLYSADFEKLASFLGQVFDIDLSFEKDIPYFELNGIRFKMFKSQQSTVSGNIEIEFSVSDAELIKELEQKYKFYCYREIGLDDIPSGMITDPDGRVWRLSVLEEDETISTKQNVSFM